MTKRRRTLMYAVPLVAMVGAAFWYGNATPKFVYRASVASPITEIDAIHYAEKAVVDAGLAQPGMAPIPFWPDSQFSDPENAERFFARNRLNPNNGYVMWDIRYTVYLEQTNDSVTCSVSRMK